MRFRGKLMRFRKTTCKSCKTTAYVGLCCWISLLSMFYRYMSMF